MAADEGPRILGGGNPGKADGSEGEQQPHAMVWEDEGLPGASGTGPIYLSVGLSGIRDRERERRFRAIGFALCQGRILVVSWVRSAKSLFFGAREVGRGCWVRSAEI
jgi:hypothetical protein